MTAVDQAIARAEKATATQGVAERAVGLLDFTSLNETDTPESIAKFLPQARTPAGPVAAVCVYPPFVAAAKLTLDGSGISVATVVNFPGGDETVAQVEVATRQALEAGADEIDVVFPYKQWLAGNTESPVQLVQRICEICAPTAAVKVILETGSLKDPVTIAQASRACLDAGVDFLKTSTGKIDVHATLPACAAMLSSILEHTAAGGKPAGIKASGGIRNTSDAARYLALADDLMGEQWVSKNTFRFGASGLLIALLDTLQLSTSAAADDSAY